MITTAILLVIGLALVVFAADWLVDGASGIARRAGVSEFVIGLTIVGFGTSCPELVVSIAGALEGNADISIGNVVGSNIFNTLFILGLTALIAPVAVSDANRKRDIPITLLVTMLLFFAGMHHSILGLGDADMINRAGGIVFLLVFSAYLYYCFKSDKVDDPQVDSELIPAWKAVILTVLGLAGLIVGGKLLVENAVAIASYVGVSDKFIAVTLLAGGTSLPELATCVVAAAKHKDQLALGNILGSNVFNILLILGASSCVTPLSFASLDYVDAAVLVASVALLWMSTYTGRRNVIDRFEGALLLAVDVFYLVWLFRSV